MGLKGGKSLSGIFIRYVIYFCISAVVLVLLYAFLVNLMFKSNIMLQANYSEQKLKENSNAILLVEKVTPNLIPEGCSYGVYDKHGSLLYGNFTKEQAKDVWTTVEKNKSFTLKGKYFYVIDRKQDICIVEYSIKMQFKSPLLRKYFPNIEFFQLVMIFILLIVEAVVLAAFFGNYLSKEIKVLIEAADNVKNRNLDFKPKHSNIREIEEVILSFDDMKDELRTSLEKQWNREKLRKEQISALAHDINTPLTIIKGNAELIKESSIEAGNMKYNDYILKSADEIEKYLRMLVDIAKSEDKMTLKRTKIKTKMFFERIVDKENALASEKNLELINEAEDIPKFFYGDEELLYRSIMNVLSNAIEYSPPFGKLLFKIYAHEDKLEFSLEDSGHGFSKEELKFAKEQFYRGDKSRNSRNHYGMGLFIASSFIKLHGGDIKLSNSKETGGGKVVLKIPLSLELIM